MTFNITFHPQINGQSKMTNKTLDDTLRGCIIDFRPAWDKYLLLVKFTYNNNFQVSIQKGPYEALYGWRRRSPLRWFDMGERQFSSPNMVQDATDKIQRVRKRMLVAQSKQKSYVDNKQKDLEF